MSLRPSLLGFLMLGCSSAAELQPSAPLLTPQGYLAELSVAQSFVGDGSSLASVGTRRETDHRRVTAEADGRFELKGLGSTARYIAAEHPTKGRAGARQLLLDGSPVVLTLGATGSIQGRITSGGVPVEGIILAATANPQAPGQQPSQALGALTGPDGEYLIDRVPPGSYNLVAMKRQDGSADSGKVVGVQVTRDQAKRVDLDLPAGSVTVVVRIGPKTDHPSHSQLLLTGPSPQVAELKPGVATQFREVVPGQYKLCAATPAGAAEQAAPSEPHCRVFLVAASPAIQEFGFD